MTYFMFATGIENSNPTIGEDRRRRDQMEECGHYARWREDFALVREIGCSFLRYGPPLHRAPEAVLADVLDGYVSRAAAEHIYGVVVQSDGGWRATRERAAATQTLHSDAHSVPDEQES